MHTVATRSALFDDDDDDGDGDDDRANHDDDDEGKLLLWSACRTLGNHFLSVSILEIATTPIPPLPQIYQICYW